MSCIFGDRLGGVGSIAQALRWGCSCSRSRVRLVRPLLRYARAFGSGASTHSPRLCNDNHDHINIKCPSTSANQSMTTLQPTVLSAPRHQPLMGAGSPPLTLPFESENPRRQRLVSRGVHNIASTVSPDMESIVLYCI